MADRPDVIAAAPHPGGTDPGIEPFEAYEVDDATVLYDAENPLAWIESSVTVRVDEAT